jgi:hypothetical protein
MSDQKVFTLDDLKRPETNDVKYDTVEAYGGIVKIGSLSSEDMLQWIESNGDPDKKKRAGLRLLVKSIVDEQGARFPESDHDAILEIFKRKDAQDNGRVLEKVLRLNGFPVPKDGKESDPVGEAKKS